MPASPTSTKSGASPPVIEGTLIAWRKSIEKRFVFNPNQPISPADIAAIKAAVLKKKSQLESDMRQSLARLQNASNGTRSIRNSLQASAVQIWNAQKQAQLNGTVLINRFTVKARLAGLAAVMAVSLILLNAIVSPSNPVPPKQSQQQVDITNSKGPKQPSESSQPAPNAGEQKQQPRRMGEGSAPPTSLDNGPSNTNVPGDLSAPNSRPSDATPRTGERTTVAKPDSSSPPAGESTAKVESLSENIRRDYKVFGA